MSYERSVTKLRFCGGCVVTSNYIFLQDGRVLDRSNGSVLTQWELDQPARDIIEVDSDLTLREFIQKRKAFMENSITSTLETNNERYPL